MNKGLIAAFVVMAGVVLNFAVPMFQNPDEPVHFAAVMHFARGAAGTGDAQSKDAATEKGIIRLMDRHDWWRFVGMGRPSPLPERLIDIPYLMGYYQYPDATSRIAGFLTYHFLAGKALRLLGTPGLEASYYLCRLFSFLLFGGALIFLAAGFGLLARSAGAALGTAFLFVLFLPQFLITGMSVGPDPFCIFLGAAVFYGAAAVLAGGAVRWRLVPALLAGAVGFVTDRSVLPLLPLAVLLLVLRINRKNLRTAIVSGLAAVLGLILLAYVLTLLFPLTVENTVLVLKNYLAPRPGRIGEVLGWTAFNRRFLALLADSFFLKFGGMAFGPGRVAIIAWRVIAAAAVLGVGVFLLRSMFAWIADAFGKPTRAEVLDVAAGSNLGGERDLKVAATTDAPDDPRDVAAGFSLRPALIKTVLFSLLAVGVQIIGVRLAAAPTDVYAQGRYLFPVIGFVGVLFAIGIRTLGNGLKRREKDEKTAGERREISSGGRDDGEAKAKEGQLIGEKETSHEEGAAGFSLRSAPAPQDKTQAEACGYEEERRNLKLAATGEDQRLGLKPEASMKAQPGDLVLDALVVLEFFFLSVALWYYIVPVFHLTIKAPHPGI